MAQFNFKSAKGVKRAARRRFGTETWGLYAAVSSDIDKKEDGIVVPLALWTARREEVNARRTKKYPEATLKNFRTNLAQALKTLRKEQDFTIEEAADGTGLCVTKK